MIKKVLLFAGVLLIASPCFAQFPLELYAGDSWQYFAARAVGSSRSQHFSPSTAMPNRLHPSESFDTAGFKLDLSSGESIDVSLYLYEWDTDYNATVATPAVASALNLEASGPFQDWLEVTADGAPLPADGSYLLRMRINAFTGPDPPEPNFALWRVGANSGGPGNDAYNDSDLKTDREYEIRLDRHREESAALILY